VLAIHHTHGEKGSNQTHASKTDPDAKIARKGKGKEAKLSYNGNLLVENRNGLSWTHAATIVLRWIEILPTC